MTLFCLTFIACCSYFTKCRCDIDLRLVLVNSISLKHYNMVEIFCFSVLYDYSKCFELLHCFTFRILKSAACFTTHFSANCTDLVSQKRQNYLHCIVSLLCQCTFLTDCDISAIEKVVINLLTEIETIESASKLSHITRKPFLRVSYHVGDKQGCRLEIYNFEN